MSWFTDFGEILLYGNTKRNISQQVQDKLVEEDTQAAKTKQMILLGIGGAVLLLVVWTSLR